MSDMNVSYLDAIAGYGRGLITHIGLVDENGNELLGGNPPYSRQMVSWTTASNGVIRPTEDLTFNIPAGKTVGGCRFYSSLTGGICYGGKDVDPVNYRGDRGLYTLLAELTGIKHISGV